MHVVFKTIHGEIQWEEKFEVDSLEAFVQLRNKRAREAGSNRDLYSVDSPRVVTEMGGNGKISGTYHLCEADGCKLI